MTVDTLLPSTATFSLASASPIRSARYRCARRSWPLRATPWHQRHRARRRQRSIPAGVHVTLGSVDNPGGIGVNATPLAFTSHAYTYPSPEAWGWNLTVEHEFETSQSSRSAMLAAAVTTSSSSQTLTSFSPEPCRQTRKAPTQTHFAHTRASRPLSKRRIRVGRSSTPWRPT